jgi:hypothetical protein
MGTLPSPTRGRRWPREAGSDEGRRGLVGTSKKPSSDPCFARAAFSRKREKEESLETQKSPASPRASGAKTKTRNQNYRTAFLSQGGTPLLKR